MIHLLIAYEDVCVRSIDGQDVEFAVEAMKYLTDKGFTLSIFTPKYSPKYGQDKVLGKIWFEKNNIPYQKPVPGADFIIISPIALGCPISYSDVTIEGRKAITKFADWYQIIRTLKQLR